MYARSYSSTEGNTALCFQLLHSVDQVLNVRSLWRAASFSAEASPALAARSECCGAGCAVTPLVRAARRGTGRWCQGRLRALPGGSRLSPAGGKGATHTGSRRRWQRGKGVTRTGWWPSQGCEPVTGQRGDELQASTSSYSTVISLQQLVHFSSLSPPAFCCISTSRSDVCVSA